MNTQRKTQEEVNAALEEFNAAKFSHPIAKDVFGELNMALGARAGAKVIILTGPTGVGKTTLALAACNRINQYYEQRMIREPDFVPVVALNAAPPSGANFSWKDFHTRLLTGQNEPLIKQKRLMAGQASLFPASGLMPSALVSEPADVLRRATEELLKRRNTQLLAIDEAHHLLLMGNRQRLECQFECLKSLSIETGTTILLTGTYRLLDILEQSGQLTRRSQIVHFRRYDQRLKEDAKDFRKVLKFFEKMLSRYVVAKLDDQAEYFYTGSVGGTGILKDWLKRCLEYALLEGISVIDAAFASQFAHKNQGLVTILEEACLGEAKLADVDDTHLKDLLANGVLFERSAVAAARSHRPGQRNPVRDPVGVTQP